MAAKKKVGLTEDRDLGTVTKRLPSGMFETSRGNKIPPFPDVTIGTKMSLTNGRYEIIGGKVKESVNPSDVAAAENEALKARIAALEKQVGERGSDTKVTPDAQTNTGGATPPKVGE